MEISLFCWTMLWTLIPEADMLLAILEVEGGSDLLAPGVFSGFAEAITSGKIRVGSTHPPLL